MIIRCRQCETRFRFEDALVTGEGIWVRCSRCRHVFFQENPVQDRRQEPLAEAVNVPEAVAAGKDAEGVAYVIDSRDEEQVQVVQADLQEERDLAIAIKEFDNLEDLTEGKKEEPVTAPAEKPEEEVRKEGKPWRIFGYLFLALLILLVFAGMYFWVFPDDRQEVIRFLSDRSSFVEKIARDYGYQDDVSRHIVIQNLEQHLVNNWLMGDLRVVEGSAVNRAKYSLTRIQIKGKLYDVGGAVIGERLSYCGNLLTDAELASLTDEDIHKKLSQPLGSNFSNERVKPGGQIPFMVILPNQPSVARTTVMVAGAERLLD